jgi:hypothetical protein
MSRRMLDLVLLAMALIAAALGLWRASVWKSGKAKDQWYGRPSDESLAVLATAIERQREVVAATRRGDNAKDTQVAEYKLRLLQSDQLSGQAEVTIAGWVEGGITIASFAAALCLWSAGRRRWQPSNEKKAGPPPAQAPPH